MTFVLISFCLVFSLSLFFVDLLLQKMEDLSEIEEIKLKEACGVFGCVVASSSINSDDKSPHCHIATIIANGLHALQHR